MYTAQGGSMNTNHSEAVAEPGRISSVSKAIRILEGGGLLFVVGLPEKLAAVGTGYMEARGLVW